MWPRCWWKKSPAPPGMKKVNGMNHQPQLVQDFFQQYFQEVWFLSFNSWICWSVVMNIMNLLLVHHQLKGNYLCATFYQSWPDLSMRNFWLSFVETWKTSHGRPHNSSAPKRLDSRPYQCAGGRCWFFRSIPSLEWIFWRQIFPDEKNMNIFSTLIQKLLCVCRIRSGCVSRLFCQYGEEFRPSTPAKTNMALENRHFSIVDTSSNGSNFPLSS